MKQYLQIFELNDLYFKSFCICLDFNCILCDNLE